MFARRLDTIRWPHSQLAGDGVGVGVWVGGRFINVSIYVENRSLRNESLDFLRQAVSIEANRNASGSTLYDFHLVPRRFSRRKLFPILPHISYRVAPRDQSGTRTMTRIETDVAILQNATRGCNFVDFSRYQFIDSVDTKREIYRVQYFIKMFG